MIRGMYVPLGHFSIYDHANQLRPSIPLSLSLSLSLAIRSRPDAGFSILHTHRYIHTRLALAVVELQTLTIVSVLGLLRNMYENRAKLENSYCNGREGCAISRNACVTKLNRNE